MAKKIPDQKQIKPDQKTDQLTLSHKPTCRRGLLAPRSFMTLASVVLLNVSVSIEGQTKDSDKEL